MTTCIPPQKFKTTTSNDMDAQLNLHYLDFIAANFSCHPTAATALGNHRFDHLLDDVSAPARARWQHYLRQTLAKLPHVIDYDKLSRDAQIDYHIFHDDLKRSIWIDEHELPYENDPRLYATKITGSIYDLFMQSTVPKATNVQNAVARMQLAPALLAEAQRNLKNPPRVVVETARQQTQGAITFFEHELYELIGDTVDQEVLTRSANNVIVALREYQQFIDQVLLPRASDSWRLGKKRFSHKLDLVLEADVSADQVMLEAKEEFARVRNAMTDIAQQLWNRYFSNRAMPANDAAGSHHLGIK